MICIFYRKLFLIILYSYLLFFHIKDEGYSSMIMLTLVIGVFSYHINKDIYEGVDDSVQFTEEEEETRRQNWINKLEEDTEDAEDAEDAEDTSEEDITADTTAGQSGDEPKTCSNFDCSDHINDIDENPSSIMCSGNTCSSEECCTSAPVPSNTPFVSAEYVKLREKSRQKDGPIVTTDNDTPDGIGPTDPDPSSSSEEFVEKEEVKLTPVESKFRIGPYDGLCISSDKLTEEDYFTNEELVTYLGVHGPMEIQSSQDILTGPTIDGEKDSPQKLTTFANNKTKFNCCGESPYTTSTGCLCLTEKQREYIRSRGYNKTSPDI